MAVGAAEFLREFDAFVDDDAQGHAGAVQQFVGADEQDAALDGRQVVDGAVEQRRQARAQHILLFQHAVEQGAEIGFVDPLELLVFLEIGDDEGDVGATHPPCVQALQCEFARELA